MITTIDQKRIPVIPATGETDGPRHWIKIRLTYDTGGPNAYGRETPRGYEITAYHITTDRGFETWTSNDRPRRLAFFETKRQSKKAEATARAELDAWTNEMILSRFPEYREKEA